jgi:hypothetical protein
MTLFCGLTYAKTLISASNARFGGSTIVINGSGMIVIETTFIGIPRNQITPGWGAQARQEPRETTGAQSVGNVSENRLWRRKTTVLALDGGFRGLIAGNLRKPSAGRWRRISRRFASHTETASGGNSL